MHNIGTMKFVLLSCIIYCWGSILSSSENPTTKTCISFFDHIKKLDRSMQAILYAFPDILYQISFILITRHATSLRKSFSLNYPVHETSIGASLNNKKKTSTFRNVAKFYIYAWSNYFFGYKSIYRPICVV